MENKEFKGMVSALEKVAGEQKRVTGALLERLEIITEQLISILEEHDLTDNLNRFDYKGYGFRWKGSRLGEYIHFCYIVDEYEEKILPTKTSDLNSSFYYHGDYNCLTYYMSRASVLKLCEILPEFVENMTSKIQALTEKEKNFLEQFNKINIEE